jgi:hypothetical protein
MAVFFMGGFQFRFFLRLESYTKGPFADSRARFLKLSRLIQKGDYGAQKKHEVFVALAVMNN